MLSNWILVDQILSVGTHPNLFFLFCCFCLFLFFSLHTSFCLDKNVYPMTWSLRAIVTLISSPHTNRILDLKRLGKLSNPVFPKPGWAPQLLRVFIKKKFWGPHPNLLYQNLCGYEYSSCIFLIFPSEYNLINLRIHRTNIYPHLTYKDTKEIPRSKAICPRSQIEFRSPGFQFLLVRGPVCPPAELEYKRSVFMDARTAEICGARHGEEKAKEKNPQACASRTPLSS